MANPGQTVPIYRELMQQQVHEEGYLVAVEDVGAVDGAAPARQVVGVDGGAEGPAAEEQNKPSSHTPPGGPSLGGRLGASGLQGPSEDYLLSSARANTPPAVP